MKERGITKRNTKKDVIDIVVTLVLRGRLQERSFKSDCVSSARLASLKGGADEPKAQDLTLECTVYLSTISIVNVPFTFSPP